MLQQNSCPRRFYGRSLSERGHGYGAGERGWSGERWGGERDWDRPQLTHRFTQEGRTGYYSVPAPSAGFGPGPGGYGSGFGATSTGMT